MWRLALAVVVLGCSEPNPRSCADGLCTDQAFPFCDVDGTLGGAQNECIAVECDPGTFRACRGDDALVCNGTGNDFDLVNCPMGCDENIGCRQCAFNTDCGNPTPVCADSECRACVADDECSSRVCEAGACLSESGIIYASAAGADNSTCSLADPCTIAHAIALASTAAPQPVIRILPGIYLSPLNVGSPTNAPLRFVATGANITSGDVAMKVDGGATVDLRGGTLAGANVALSCGAANSSHSTLSVGDVTFADTNGGNLVIAINCELHLATSTLALGNSGGGALSAATDALLIADRVHISGTKPSVTLFGQRAHLAVTNSVLEDVQFLFITTDATNPGSGASFAFNTVVLTSDSNQIGCDGNSSSATRHIDFRSNILFASGTNLPSVFSGTTCTVTNNLMSPQLSPPAGNTVADPQFVDFGGKDFHLKSTSPARDAADQTFFTDHDFENTARPQGAGPDIGAFEQ